ncbi:MAG: tetratricopeptide repeat protein [Saprospiraceae bacterium]|nr:tetratricopeptide repeat protein [Saprospiraceae bacterium]
MKNTWNNLDLIESWKNNEMDETSRLQFENRLKQDSDLKEELGDYDRVTQYIERFGNERTRRILTNVENDLEKEGFFNSNSANTISIKHKTIHNTKVWAFAASMVLLVGLSLWIFNNRTQVPPLPNIAELKLEKPHIAHTLSELNVAGFADKEKGKKDSLSSAILLLKADQYVEARYALHQYLEAYPDDNTAQLYLGIAYVHAGKYAKGAKYLTPLTRLASSNEDRDLAKWYASMCYVQFNTEHDLQTAKFLLKELADDPSSIYTDHARAYFDLLNDYK